MRPSANNSARHTGCRRLDLKALGANLAGRGVNGPYAIGFFAGLLFIFERHGAGFNLGVSLTFQARHRRGRCIGGHDRDGKLENPFSKRLVRAPKKALRSCEIFKCNRAMLFDIGSCTFKRTNIARACNDVAGDGRRDGSACADGSNVLKAGEKLLRFSFKKR